LAASQAHGKIIDQPDRWPLQPSSQRKLSTTKVKKEVFTLSKIKSAKYTTAPPYINMHAHQILHRGN
jgi:hypothetical protein